MSILKASVTTVQFGPFTMEGLMNEKGEFGVALPQMADMDLVPRNRSLTQVKALLGKGFPSHEVEKWKTPLNSNPVNVIKLDGLQTVIRILDKQGNPTASQFVDLMLGLSLHQIFSDAFGIKFEKEERQQWLATRIATKKDFRPLTDALKAAGFQDEDYPKFIGAFQKRLGIKAGTRDELDAETLVKLQGVQVRLTTLMECGITPWDALKRIN